MRLRARHWLGEVRWNWLDSSAMPMNTSPALASTAHATDMTVAILFSHRFLLLPSLP